MNVRMNGKGVTGNTYVAYYRVSIDKRGVYGLGLAAQQYDVENFISRDPDAVWLACYQEIAHGTRRGNNRPGLMAALELCKLHKATLVVAKLDRLTRDPDFLEMLMKSGVHFVCCDMPEADGFVLRTMIAYAEHEAEMISKRTREGMARGKAKGHLYGNARSVVSVHLALAERRIAALAFAESMKPVLFFYLRDGYSLTKIAAEFNRQALPTASGSGTWTKRTVQNLLAWVDSLSAVDGGGLTDGETGIRQPRK